MSENRHESGQPRAHGGNKRGGSLIQAVDRALAILDQFNEHTPRLGVTELSGLLGLPKTTVHGLAKTLAHRGFLEQDATGKYRLGIRVYQLGMTYAGSIELRSAAQPWAERLSGKYNEIVHVAIYAGGMAVFVFKHEPPRRFMVYPRIGSSVPAHATAVGKVLLANLGRAEQERYVREAGLPALTKKTITDAHRLFTELDEIRRQGFAVDREEAMIGLGCVAAPIWNDEGETVAAISLSGPAERTLGAEHEEMVQEVKISALSISRSLGYLDG